MGSFAARSAPARNLIRAMVRAGAVVVLAGLAVASPTADATPVPALPPLVQRYGTALLQVERGGTRAAGFFVATRGIACTVLPGAHVDDVVTLTLGSGTVRDGRVVAIGADGVALVAVVPGPDEPDGFASVGVTTRDALPGGAWLVTLALRTDRARVDVEPAVGTIESVHDGRWRMILPAPRGAPVLLDGEVVGVVVEQRGGGVAIARPASVVRALAAGLSRDRP